MTCELRSVIETATGIHVCDKINFHTSLAVLPFSCQLTVCCSWYLLLLILVFVIITDCYLFLLHSHFINVILYAMIRLQDKLKIVVIKYYSASTVVADPSGRAVLRRGSTAARLLELRVRMPLGAWVLVCCECCVSSGRGVCYRPISCPGESYRL